GPDERGPGDSGHAGQVHGKDSRYPGRKRHLASIRPIYPVPGRPDRSSVLQGGAGEDQWGDTQERKPFHAADFNFRQTNRVLYARMPVPGENAMNFSKLPKEKKQHLLIIGVITVAALVGLGWGLIKTQFDNLGRLAEKKVATQKKLQRIEDAVKRVRQIEAELAESRKQLAAMEEDMASGDLYSWVINTLRKFKTDYK